jgi:hypothetical protein
VTFYGGSKVFFEVIRVRDSHFGLGCLGSIMAEFQFYVFAYNILELAFIGRRYAVVHHDGKSGLNRLHYSLFD